MRIVDYYQSEVKNNRLTDDFELYSFSNDLFVGFDSDNCLCVVIKSSSVGRNPSIRKTKLLSIECNQCLSYFINGEQKDAVVHIIRCFSSVEKERIVFLELIEASVSGFISDEEILEVFQILSHFFADRTEPSDSELIGLYGELDAIISFSPSVHIEDFWQSKDHMKFDFSFSDTLKLEIKTTTKNIRTHHFKHEQLVTEMYSIIILSYMLRYDDEGVSLYDLILEAKPLLYKNPQKLIRLEKIIKNTTEERLKAFRFSPEYTEEKRHFYLATAIPRFEEMTPDGVANAEYDCNLENLTYLRDEDFVTIVKKELEGEQDGETC